MDFVFFIQISFKTFTYYPLSHLDEEILRNVQNFLLNFSFEILEKNYFDSKIFLSHTTIYFDVLETNVIIRKNLF